MDRMDMRTAIDKMNSIFYARSILTSNSTYLSLLPDYAVL